VRFSSTLVLLAAGILWSATAQAVFYGSPVPDLKEGELAVGVAASDFSRKIRVDRAGTGSEDYSRETVLADYGLSGDGMLRVELSTVDLGALRGTELAAGYRRRFGTTSRVGDEGMPLHKGYFASVRTASLSEGGSDADFIQIDLGAGAALVVSEAVSLYAGGVFSRLDGTIANSDFEGDSSLGLFGGGQIALEEAMLVGGEIHLLMESGFALFFRFRF
jgi:hypothetical protein